MDHHGLLTLTRQLNQAFTEARTVRTGPPSWKWHSIPVICPESHCPFCHNVIRSNGIWFLTKEPPHDRLLGAVFPGEPGGKVRLIMPDHPHDTGGGYLCLGKNRTGIDLLTSTPNISDTPMGRPYIPRWQKRYWGRHDCQEARTYLEEHFRHERGYEIWIKELNEI